VRGLLLLDLDGTLIDSVNGITESAINAFEAVGLTPPPDSILRGFVGPPIAESLLAAGVPAELLEAAVRGFRSDFAGASLRGSEVYAGVPQALAEIQDRGFRLAVATSKPEIYARPLCEELDLARLLDGVFGAPPDGAMATKAEIIARALFTLGGPTRAVMLGDRHHDVHGAAANGLPCLGAGWGYASPGELEDAGAVAVVPSPAFLPAAVESLLG
jgi:phosphoglycolate phosphatase